jgi:conjugative transfer signal peptidase TraF
MMASNSIFVLTGLGVGLAIASSLVEPRPILVWNATASAPRGLYCIAPLTALQAGDLVLFQPDPASAAVYAERGYLPFGVALLKHVGALGGMRVCEHGGDVTIEGRHVANALPIDGRGRLMSSWSGCRALSDGEFFALNADVPTSLDGRYFGPSPLSSVIGRAIPVWTVKER